MSCSKLNIEGPMEISGEPLKPSKRDPRIKPSSPTSPPASPTSQNLNVFDDFVMDMDDDENVVDIDPPGNPKGGFINNYVRVAVSKYFIFPSSPLRIFLQVNLSETNFDYSFAQYPYY